MGTTVADDLPDARPPTPAEHPSTRGSGPSTERTRSKARHRRIRPRRAPGRTRPPTMLVLLCLAVVVPVLASTVRALHDGWTPVGDNATLALRAGDVLDGDPPLTGTAMASNVSRDEALSHPGPLEAWVLAIPYAVIGPAGLLITVAFVNAGALVLGVIVGWRRGGPPLAVAVTATSLVLCWSLGATVLREPLNTSVAVLPWFALVLLAWNVRRGSWSTLPAAVAVACWVAQAHVAYASMTAVLVVGTTALCVVDQRARTSQQRQAFGRGRRQAAIWAVTIGVLAWLPALIDQVNGSGNLGRLIGSVGEPGQGVRVGAGAVIAAFGATPALLGPSDDPFTLLRTPGLADLIGFAVTAALFAWGYAAAHRRSDARTVTLLQGALLGALGAVVAVAIIPQGDATLTAALWLLRPVTAVVWLAIGWAAWCTVAPVVRRELADPARRTAATAAGTLAAVAIIAVTVFAPASFGGYGEGLMAPIAKIEPAVVDAVDGQRLVQVNASGSAARQYLRPAVIEDLERHGIRTRTTDATAASGRAGQRRGTPTATLWVVSDPVEPKPPEPGAVLIARTDLVPGGGLSAAALRRAKLRRILNEAGQVELRGTDQVSLGDVRREILASTTLSPDRPILPANVVSIDAFVGLHRNGLVAAPMVDESLIAEIERDSIGRRSAAEDTEVAIYLRVE